MISNGLTLKRVFNILYNAINAKPAQYTLGRWGMHHTSEQTNLKADHANEDHCGTCAQFVSSKEKEKE